MKLSRALLYAALGCSAHLFAAPLPDWDSVDDWRTKMQPIVPRGYVCKYTALPIKVDGKLDDPAWAAAPWTEDFVDIEGPTKPKPRLRTRAKMLWDENYLYIGAELEEPDVWGTLTKHDSIIFQDPDFEVFIDPDGDTHEYYEFEINALNTSWDLFLPKPYKDGGQADNGWEIPGLKSAVYVNGTINDPTDHDQGWSVEIAFPWRVLAEKAHRPAPPLDGDQWRTGFSRVEWPITKDGGKYAKVPNTSEDNWVWSPQGIVDMHRPERWGYVQFSRKYEEAFVPDPARRVRDALQELYYAERAYRKKNGHWASTLQELGITPPTGETAPTLHTSAEGWEASLPLGLPNGKTQLWKIRTDSRIWPDDSTVWWPASVENALAKAGANRAELTKALTSIPESQRDGLQFLVENMPEQDLQGLTANYLIENAKLAYDAIAAAPWAKDVPHDIFLNEILPYASLNERRDEWRPRLRELALPLIRNCRTSGEAAQALNRQIFKLVNVRYSTERQKPDQSSLESMASGLASCSGLSILLVDACRAVGAPARVAGTPMWTNMRGNHTWVEVWDGGWHFVGAAEPDAKGLDHTWFTGDAAQAQRDAPSHAIYASSFRQTGLNFPLVWDFGIQWVPAVNVTDRYTGAAPPTAADDRVRVLLHVLDQESGKRIAANVRITDASDPSFKLEGRSRDESADLNNILTFQLPRAHAYKLHVDASGKTVEQDFTTTAGKELEQTVTIECQSPR
jgi:transglutaminase-like putative cysteine protease